MSVLSANAEAAQVNLSWLANSESNISGYKIYYGTSSGNYTSSFNVGLTTSYNLTGVTSGQTYYFALTAYNSSFLESNYSPEVSITVSGSSPTPTPTPIITPTPISTPIPTPPPVPGPTPHPGNGGGSQDSDNDGLSDSREASIGTNPNDADSDDDGISDGQEVTDTTNPLDRGSNYQQLKTFFCNEWNGYINGTNNLVEVNNRSSQTINAQLIFYGSSGNFLDIKQLSIPAGQQRRNNFDNFQGSQYQLAKICILHDGNTGDLEGQIINYKQGQYATSTPFANGLYGKQYVRFNTKVMSKNSAEKIFKITNQIKLYNNSNTTRGGSLNFYREDGSLLTQKYVELSYYQVFNFDVSTLGVDFTGLVEWVPGNIDSPFVLRNTAMYYDNSSSRESFVTALNYDGASGTGEDIIVPFDTSFIADNCTETKVNRKGKKTKVKKKNCKKTEKTLNSTIEISNSLESNNNVLVNIYNTEGVLLSSQKLSLNSHASKEIVLKDVVGYNIKGTVIINGEQISSVLASAKEYLRNKKGNVLLSYQVAAKIAYGSVLQGSYDASNDRKSSLVLVNSNSYDEVVSYGLSTSDGSTVSQGETVRVPAHGRRIVDLNPLMQGTQDGLVTVQPTSQNTIASWIYKEKQDEFLVPTTVR